LYQAANFHLELKKVMRERLYVTYYGPMGGTGRWAGTLSDKYNLWAIRRAEKVSDDTVDGLRSYSFDDPQAPVLCRIRLLGSIPPCKGKYVLKHDKTLAIQIDEAECGLEEPLSPGGPTILRVLRPLLLCD